jgi:hypothetical protein
MIFLFSLFITFFTIWRGIIPQKITLKWKIIAAILSAMISFKFYIFSLASGKLFSAPQWHPYILITFTWLYALIIFFVIFLLIYEFFRAATKVIAKLRKKELPAFFTNPAWRLTPFLPAVILTTLGMYNGLKVPGVTRYEIKSPALPEELQGPVREGHQVDRRGQGAVRLDARVRRRCRGYPEDDHGQRHRL